LKKVTVANCRLEARWQPWQQAVVSGNTSANTSFCHTVFVVAIYKYVLYNARTYTHTQAHSLAYIFVYIYIYIHIN